MAGLCLFGGAAAAALRRILHNAISGRLYPFGIKDLPKDDRLLRRGFRHNRGLTTKGSRGLILGERKTVASVRHAAGVALLLPFLLLPGCSDLALPSEETPRAGIDPGYNNIVAQHLKALFKNHTSYDAFEISAFRWVHALKGWSWITCVRFQDQGNPRSYAVFLKDNRVIDSRYAVQTDACDIQTYVPFDAMRPARPGLQSPLY